MKLAPTWKRLRDESESWNREGEDFVLCHLVDQKSQENFTAFVEAHPNFEAKVEGLFKAFSQDRDVTAKLVGCSELVQRVKSVFEKMGIEVEKTVERDGRFSVMFHGKEKKIFASKFDPVAAKAAKEKQAAEKAAAAAVVSSGGAIHSIRKQKNGKVRVLVVDDSNTIRKLLTMILTGDPDIEVVGAFANPLEVEAAILRLKPDVITLDIHMPELNGVDLLKRYISKTPIPTVMISALSMEEGPHVLNALEAGAVDYIQKPSANDMDNAVPIIIGKVKAAANAVVMQKVKHEETKKIVVETHTDLDLKKIIAIGSSTGGTEALKVVLMRLPETIPPIVIVQHIPAVFSAALASRLNDLCPFEVKEGKDGDEVLPNRVIIAPGGLQMKLKKSGDKYKIVVDDSEPVNRHKPSVDYLFSSVAKECKGDAVGVILTGMGSDGAKGLLEMKKAGALTFAQNEATSVVYGMPQAAHKIGATDKLLPLEDIAGVIVDSVKLSKKAKAS